MIHESDEENRPEVLISAIEHYSYCPRQCGLIHIEQTFDENVFTMRGRLAHERVHSEDDAASHGTPCVRGVPLWSDRLGLRGKSDLIELRPEGPYPIEYKIGREVTRHTVLQLCAQALCLEDMLGVTVAHGAVFCWGTRRRHEVSLDATTREQTLRAVEAIRAMLRDQRVPDAVNDARCRECSLKVSCMPEVLADRVRQQRVQTALFRPVTTVADDA